MELLKSKGTESHKCGALKATATVRCPVDLEQLYEDRLHHNSRRRTLQSQVYSLLPRNETNILDDARHRAIDLRLAHSSSYTPPQRR